MNKSNNNMKFFFEYIYYRITQLFFKRDGRTGFSGIAFITIMQTLFIESFIIEISKWVLSIDQRALYSKQFGYLGTTIALLIMYYNYKKHNGKYNQYRFYWKDETKSTRILKGLCIFLSFLVPIALVIIFGIHWKQS